jgi:hypothetical protein
MTQFDPKTLTACLIGLVAAGSIFAQLKTWHQFREQEHKELLSALIVYLTLAACMGLLVVAVWTH